MQYHRRRDKSQERITKKPGTKQGSGVCVKNSPEEQNDLAGSSPSICRMTNITGHPYQFQDYEDEIIFLAAHKSKRNPDTKDWIIVLPMALGKTIVQENGLTIGLHFCRVRTHTSVQRCRNCQDFSHSTKFYQNRTFCPNCSQKHEPRACDDKLMCINCIYSNNENGTHIRRATSPLIIPARF